MDHVVLDGVAHTLTCFVFLSEVRVKAQKPGDKQLQEVLYSTEAHTDRSFCRTGVNILPWKHKPPGMNCKRIQLLWRMNKYLFVYSGADGRDRF